MAKPKDPAPFKVVLRKVKGRDFASARVTIKPLAGDRQVFEHEAREYACDFATLRNKELSRSRSKLKRRLARLRRINPAPQFAAFHQKLVNEVMAARVAVYAGELADLDKVK